MRISFFEFENERAKLGLGFEGFMRFKDEEERAEIAIFGSRK